MARKPKQPKQVETLKHDDAKRRNIPTAEYQSVMADDDKSPIWLAYQRRNRDLDPQLVWRGKDEQDWSDLVVPAPPLYIQEKVHPKVLIDDLLRESAERAKTDGPQQLSMFADFNGLPEGADATDFYRHEGNWSNRLILGDSLQVMASLAEREGLRGQVQCIYLDPPYGIKFNSNFQWSTTSRDVKDGKSDHITREPEQVKAFRDTWRDGIHSYLTYLRDRLTVARDLLKESGSLFMQIGSENVHRVRALMDEVLGEDNYISLIHFQTTTGQASELLPRSGDYIIWYAKDKTKVKTQKLYELKNLSNLASYSQAVSKTTREKRKLTREEQLGAKPIDQEWLVYSAQNLRSQDSGSEENRKFTYQNRIFDCGPNHHWKTNPVPGLKRLEFADRLQVNGNTPNYIRYVIDYPVIEYTDQWDDTAIAGFSGDKKRYVVETPTKVIERCILLTTTPGDLILDPTCGSGTTAYVAEQWGRRWITIDTSRVALALARARIMGARYPYYLLADSKAGQQKEAEISRTAPSTVPTYGSIRHGFVYERVPHIMLKDIANNAEIDVIWATYQEKLEPLRAQLNDLLQAHWPAINKKKAFKLLEEWEIPRARPDNWPAAAELLLAQWWELRIGRQQEIDASIAAKADQEYLYDKPYEDKSTVRVAGPFTVDSLSPHRVLVVDENDDLVQQGTYGRGENFIAEKGGGYDSQADAADFAAVILENLKTAGVQQAHKEDRIRFTALTGWPGSYICAEGHYMEGEHGKERRAGIFIGPEFGTVAKPDLVAAAREAGDAGFDVLIACAFNYDAHSAEFEKLGRVPILKARMNADLHMAGDLANTGAGNLFVIFGEPDIAILPAADGQIQVQIHGVDVFHPQSGEVRSSGPDGIACWFIDTNYNEESFFVRHAYFLGANDPYSSLKTTLKAEIDEEAWESLHSDISRAFDKPETGRIAVKVINHLGDEVMKVFSISS